MESRPAEVPPYGPPSPMVSLLAAFVGLVALAYAAVALSDAALWRGGVGVAIALGAFAVAGASYRRFRVQEAAFDRHLREHGGEP